MKRTSKKNIDDKVPKKNISKETVSQNSFLQNNLKYFFLLLILFSILIELYFAFFSKISTEDNFIFELRKFLIIPTIVIGAISIWFEKEKLIQIINELFNENQQTLFYKIKASLNKKNIVFSSLFILVLGISIFTLFYKLDHFDLYSDEISVVRGATGYNETGEYKQWDFIKEETVGKAYNRAKPHQYITALSLKLFGTGAWAARFPSALFSVLLIAFIYFFGSFFIKDKQAVLLTAFSIALFFQFLTLGRWTRMYAMVFPAFLLAYYWTFSFLTKPNTLKLFNNEKKALLNRYFNFNYIVLPFLLFLLYINLFTHQNSALIFPVFLLFSVFSVFLFYKEKKYITASVVFISVLIIQILSPFKVGFSRFTFFEVNNSEHYSDILFGFPLSVNVNIVFLAIGLFIFFLIKNISFRKSYLALFITAGLTWVLFSFIFNYPSHFRYVSFVVPLIILLIIALFSLINKVLFNKPIQFLLAFLLVTSVSIHFMNNYNGLYVTNNLSPAKPSVAYKSISENYKDGEVIFRHWGPKIYMKGINPDTKFISLGSYKGRIFADLFEEINQHNSGWITWHSYNGLRIDKQFQNYTNLYFKKLHGIGMDDSGVEVFYFNKEMLVPLEQFFAQQYLPTANLNLSNSYSIAFDLHVDSLTNGFPFTFKEDSIDQLVCRILENNLIIKSAANDSVYMQLPANKKSHIVWHQEVNGNMANNALSLNGKLISEIEFETQQSPVKFQVNPYFRGDIDNIRIYDMVLNSEQKNEIIKNQKNENTQDLFVGEDKFTALYLWKKR